MIDHTLHRSSLSALPDRNLQAAGKASREQRSETSSLPFSMRELALVFGVWGRESWVDDDVMVIAAQLRRLDRLMSARDGWLSAAPGASDVCIERLRTAVAPLVLPPSVEELYRWHDGIDLALLDGYGVQSIDGVLAERPFLLEVLGHPPAWLVISAPPGGTGVRCFATAAERGSALVEAIWSEETHDQYMTRKYDSIGAAIDVFCDMLEDCDAEVAAEQVGRGDMLGLPRSEEQYQLARSPTAFSWPRVPAGTLLPRVPDPSWPDVWLTSLGTSKDELMAEDPGFDPSDLARRIGALPQAD